MPTAILYLLIMLGVIGVWFILFKRPIYEGVLLSILVLLTVTGTWANVWDYVIEGLNSTLVFSMIVFVAMSQLLKYTGILDDCIACILAVFGRITGGAGYATVIASAFMGAFSGSGPGNVMAVGTITIPAMKKSGFPAELAANVQGASSCLGNMIPPSSNIIGALGAYMALYPDTEVTTGQFWMVMWGLSFWFILQRIITVFVFCKIYHVEPMKKEDLPDLRTVFRNGWKGLLLPVIIILPFILDSALNAGFFTERLGASGAKYLSSSILLFTAGIASFYAVLISGKKEIKSIKGIAGVFTKSIKGLVPTVSTVIFGYIIGALFSGVGVAAELEGFINGLSLGRFGMAVIISLLTCFLGMVIPGSSLTVMFGELFISVMAATGIDPLLAAAMLPCICGAMGNITPPFALCMYAGMGLAESDFGKTVKNDMWWVLTQFSMQLLILMGWLPILGV
ncbi:MAG: TRAP transporter permease [Clostridia bacterium]|nr:TRAP transporter permease [Clostridia bacterium]